MKTVEKIERKLPVLKTRKRVAAYARVSMESERMQHSLSAQVSYYSALIQKNPEWEYAGVFADYGISGTGTKKREEFNRINSTKKRRVAAYARVSTDNEEQLTSYEAQIDYYTNYINGRDDWEFVGVYPEMCPPTMIQMHPPCTPDAP